MRHESATYWRLCTGNSVSKRFNGGNFSLTLSIFISCFGVYFIMSVPFMYKIRVKIKFMLVSGHRYGISCSLGLLYVMSVPVPNCPFWGMDGRGAVFTGSCDYFYFYL